MQVNKYSKFCNLLPTITLENEIHTRDEQYFVQGAHENHPNVQPARPFSAKKHSIPFAFAINTN